MSRTDGGDTYAADHTMRVMRRGARAWRQMDVDKWRRPVQLRGNLLYYYVPLL